MSGIRARFRITIARAFSVLLLLLLMFLLLLPSTALRRMVPVLRPERLHNVIEEEVGRRQTSLRSSHHARVQIRELPGGESDPSGGDTAESGRPAQTIQAVVHTIELRRGPVGERTLIELGYCLRLGKLGAVVREGGRDRNEQMIIKYATRINWSVKNG